MNLNTRQKEILKTIVEKYIKNNVAISSLYLRKSALKSFSSATIRNDMVSLEKHGFLKKEHQFSGRAPTKEGYKVYIESLMENSRIKNFEIKEKLIDLFSQRHESIDNTLSKSVELISNFLNLPLVVTNTNDMQKELLKKIDITQLNENNYIIFVVSSSGEIHKNEIIINDFIERKDLNMCIELLNEKLLDCPFGLINQKINEITPLLIKQVHQFELLYNSIIKKVVDKLLQKAAPVSKIYNTKSIFLQPEIQNNQIDFNKIFDLLENYSTFSQLKFNYLKTGKTLINLDNVDGVAIASTVIQLESKTHELSVVGPTRMNYPLVKCLLEFLNEKLINLK